MWTGVGVRRASARPSTSNGAILRATRRPWLALALAALYASSDEIHQHFVEGRHGAPLDVAIDTVGALAGILAWSALARRRAP